MARTGGGVTGGSCCLPDVPPGLEGLSSPSSRVFRVTHSVPPTPPTVRQNTREGVRIGWDGIPYVGGVVAWGMGRTIRIKLCSFSVVSPAYLQSLT